MAFNKTTKLSKENKESLKKNIGIQFNQTKNIYIIEFFFNFVKIKPDGYDYNIFEKNHFVLSFL